MRDMKSKEQSELSVTTEWQLFAKRHGLGGDKEQLTIK